MTEAYYKTRNYNTNHSAFGGLIYNYDFDNYISMSNIAERIVSDSKFDKQCKRNILYATTIILKLIGKTILDSIGWTKKLGGITQPKIEPIIKMNSTRFNEFKAYLDNIKKDPVQVDLYLKAHGLEQVEGLRDYILNNKIQQGSINELITQQNYQNIANQAHGFTGVNAAIKEYNKLTDEASKSKLAETINGTNAKLGTYLTNLKGSSANIYGYAGSLVVATAKTFALQAATMALNAAISFGISLLIQGLVSIITNLFSQVENTIDRISKLNDELSESKSKLEEYTSELSDINQRIQEINSLDSLSFADEEELKKLQDQKSELETLYNIEKARYDLKQQDAKDAAKQYFGKNETYSVIGTSVYEYEDENGETKEVKHNQTISPVKANKADQVKYAIDNALYYQKLIDEATEEFSKIENPTQDNIDIYTGNIHSYETSRDRYKEDALKLQEENETVIDGLDSTSEFYTMVRSAGEYLNTQLGRLNGEKTSSDIFSDNMKTLGLTSDNISYLLDSLSEQDC